MSMDLLYLNNDNRCESLLNCTATNSNLFCTFVKDCLESDVDYWKKEVNNHDKNLDVDPNNEDHEKWLLDQQEEEKDLLQRAIWLLDAWESDTPSLGATVEAMGTAIRYPGHEQFNRYIAQIISDGTNILVHKGNPNTYWA